jgi:hypothetical protein
MIKTSGLYGYWISPSGEEFRIDDMIRHADLAKKLGFGDLDEIFDAGYVRVVLFKGMEIQTLRPGQLTPSQKTAISSIYLDKRRIDPLLVIVGGFDSDPDNYIESRNLNQVFQFMDSGSSNPL